MRALEGGEACSFLLALADRLGEASCFDVALLAQIVDARSLCHELAVVVGETSGFGFLLVAREPGQACGFLFSFLRELGHARRKLTLLHAQGVEATLRLHLLALVIRATSRFVFLVLVLELGEACRFLSTPARELDQSGRFDVSLLAQGFHASLLLHVLALELGQARGFLVALATELDELGRFFLLLCAQARDEALSFHVLALAIRDGARELGKARGGLLLLCAQVVQAGLLLDALALVVGDPGRFGFLLRAIEIGETCDLLLVLAGELDQARRFDFFVFAQRVDPLLRLDAIALDAGEP